MHHGCGLAFVQQCQDLNIHAIAIAIPITHQERLLSVFLGHMIPLHCTKKHTYRRESKQSEGLRNCQSVLLPGRVEQRTSNLHCSCYLSMHLEAREMADQIALSAVDCLSFVRRFLSGTGGM